MTIARDDPAALAAAPDAGLKRRRARQLALAALAVFALALPFGASGYHLFQFSQVLIYAIALLGLNILTGYNGQISLGHGAFYAIGGYASAILMTNSASPTGRRCPSRA